MNNIVNKFKKDKMKSLFKVFILVLLLTNGKTSRAISKDDMLIAASTAIVAGIPLVTNFYNLFNAQDCNGSLANGISRGINYGSVPVLCFGYIFYAYILRATRRNASQQNVEPANPA